MPHPSSIFAQHQAKAGEASFHALHPGVWGWGCPHAKQRQRLVPTYLGSRSGVTLPWAPSPCVQGGRWWIHLCTERPEWQPG